MRAFSPTSSWILPLVAGLLPPVASLAAFGISVSQDLIPACNPFVDGCVSVSRAARHGLANQVFRALVLPAAALQGLTWWLCATWLRRLGATGRSLEWLRWLGIAAAAFLVLYAIFLGTEGDAYRWMRRYGIVGYFGGTFLCMLVTGGHLRRLSAAGLRIPARLEVALLALLGIILLMGLANVFVPPFVGDDGFKNRLENVLEWHAGILYAIYFAVLAWLWRRKAFSA
jgi:xanthosine utilization system XapX-like protein